ncbi:MAG: cytochrome P450 [Acidimicrobiia bacterium]
MSQAPEVKVGASEADAIRNRMFGAGLVDDPYPTYHRLITEGPVLPGGINDQFAEMGEFRMPGAQGTAISVHSHEACVHALRRADVYSSSSYDQGLRFVIGHSIIGMDEPEHRRMRLLLQPAFTKSEMERWKTEIILPIVDEHLDRIVGRGRADLYEEIAPAVPIHTISAALGLPTADRRQFFEWAVGMTSMGAGPEARLDASKAVGEYVAPLIAARREQPGDDLITILVEATVPPDEDLGDLEPRPLDDDEITTFVRLLIIAGAGTTYRAYGNLMFFLLTHPEQFAAVRDDRALVPAAIEESLRIEQPLAQILRVATEESDLRGVPIPAGCSVQLNVGAANHDAAQWQNPEEFDIFRERPDRHLSFGFGIHRCLGIHLARAELDVLLNRTIDRLPNLRLDPQGAGDVHMTGLGFRMVTALPVLFD